MIFSSMRSKTSLALATGFNLTNGQQIMNNEFRTAAQKKGGGGQVMTNNESHWSSLTAIP